MTATVIGELTSDERTIILIADGPDHEVAMAARYMQSLTPLVGDTDPPGGLQCPATWAVVVQLAATFGQWWKPGPRLADWTMRQLVARTAVDPDAPGALRNPPPAHLTPRPYQVAAARMIALCGSALLFDDMGPQPTSTPILTPTSWTTLGELVPGGVVFDLHGRPARVRAVKRFGEQDVYRVHLNDRTSTLATAEHRWRVYTANDRRRDNGGRVLSTRELQETGVRDSYGNARYYLPQQPVLEGLGAEGGLPLDPYAYGALLGDGALGGEHLSITCPDEFILGFVQQAARNLGTTARAVTYEGRCPAVVFHRDGKLRSALGELGALVGAADKHVHPRYLLAPEVVRRDVLAGLLDTDGTVIKTGGGVEFSSASPQLAADVAWLSRSLGAVVTESDPQPAGYRDNDGERVECLPKHRVLARFPAAGESPFWVPRKAGKWTAAVGSVQRPNPPRTVRVIEPAGRAEVCCIELDTDDEASRVYLTDKSLIPTHNTGKSVSTILGLRERAEAVGANAVLPVVVVCPNGVMDSWIEHVRAWAPELRVVPWRGAPGRRKRRIGTADVYVASYGTAARDAKSADQRQIAHGRMPLMSLAARTVIADEVHKIKDASSSYSRAVRNLATLAHQLGGGFVGLSGTPITHSPRDLWPALYCCSPHAWPSSERWAFRYCDTVPGDYGRPTVLGLNARAEPEFRDTIMGQYRRVSKADVLADLPPKVYSVRTVEVPERWRKVYDDVESAMLAELPGGGELEAMSVLAQLTRLLQLASSAADVTVTEENVEDPATGLPLVKRHQHVTLKAPSWKVDELLEVLAERPGQQVACYAPSRQLMVLAGEAAEALGHRVGYIIGGQSPAERTGTVDAFQRGELDLICVTTGAGGVGLTLTAASTAVFLQRPWSIVEAMQAEDRQHRIGSERHESVEIIDVVAAKTIETRVRALLKDKAQQLSDLVQDPRIVAELLGGAGVRDLRKKAAA